MNTLIVVTKRQRSVRFFERHNRTVHCDNRFASLLHESGNGSVDQWPSLLLRRLYILRTHSHTDLRLSDLPGVRHPFPVSDPLVETGQLASHMPHVSRRGLHSDSPGPLFDRHSARILRHNKNFLDLPYALLQQCSSVPAVDQLFVARLVVSDIPVLRERSSAQRTDYVRRSGGQSTVPNDAALVRMAVAVAANVSAEEAIGATAPPITAGVGKTCSLLFIDYYLNSIIIRI